MLIFSWICSFYNCSNFGSLHSICQMSHYDVTKSTWGRHLALPRTMSSMFKRWWLSMPEPPGFCEVDYSNETNNPQIPVSVLFTDDVFLAKESIFNNCILMSGLRAIIIYLPENTENNFPLSCEQICRWVGWSFARWTLSCLPAASDFWFIATCSVYHTETHVVHV